MELANLHNRKEKHFIMIRPWNTQEMIIVEVPMISPLILITLDQLSSYSKVKQYDKTVEYTQPYLDDNLTWKQFKERVQEQISGKVNYMNIDFEIYAHSTLYHLIALSYLELNNLDLAEEYIDRALTLDKNSPDFNK